MLTHWVLTIMLRDKYYVKPHFTDEVTETHRPPQSWTSKLPKPVSGGNGFRAQALKIPYDIWLLTQLPLLHGPPEHRKVTH